MSDLIKPVTSADIEQLEASTGRYYELINGELRAKAMASPKHSKIITLLVRRIGAFVEDHNLGDTYESSCSYILKGTNANPELIYLPDFSFVRAERVDNRYRGFYELAPDLAVEVISSSERSHEMKAKVQDYLDCGVRQVWQVFPEEKQVIVYLADGTRTTYGENDTVPGGDVLPGFELPVAKLW